VANEKAIEARMFHDIVIATPSRTGLWDRNQIHEISDKLIRYVDVKKPPALILNLEHVEKISSEAISALIKIRDHTLGQDCQFRLCALQQVVWEVLRIMDLPKLFEIYETLPQAYRGLLPEGEEG
jgi:anti-anti-sigma factor